ncbi:MAG: alpha/beta hydrolase [Bacilli bacterium]|nr:alpha/beta hydrolase [Bacilli bacterium]
MNKKSFFTIIHFHGGGLVEGDKGDAHLFCEHLCKLGYAVVSANYSLMPKAKFPDYLYDAANAVKYVMDNISKHGKSRGFIISGQSAGAWITLMLCFNKDYLESVGINTKMICGWVSDAAQTTSHFNILKIEKDLHPWIQRIDECAPLYYVNEKTTFSRLLLLAYENDLPNRIEQNQLLLSTIKSFDKDADVEFKILKGNHCQGSSTLDSDGEFEVVKIMEVWLDK